MLAQQTRWQVYDDVIERSKIPFKKILVVTDGGNDCAEHLFRKYGDRKDIKVFFASSLLYSLYLSPCISVDKFRDSWFSQFLWADVSQNVDKTSRIL